jgi:hypothetical protein
MISKITIIFLIFCLIFTKDFNKSLKKTNGNQKILLIDYYEEYDFEVLKDYKNKKKKYRYNLSGQPIENLNYNQHDNILCIDFKMSDTSKLFFMANGKVFDISIPYQFSDILLNGIVNDSLLDFTLLTKKIILKPDDIYIDTLVTINKEGKRVIRYTKIIYVKNYGLIEKQNILDLEGQKNWEIKQERIRDSLEMEYLKQD